MIPKNYLDTNQEIPKIFRTGLLRADSLESLSRLMSEIENNSSHDNMDDAFDGDEDMIENELKKLRNDSPGDTSVNSLMEDSPTKYNVLN